jgi:hypothetical protein
VAGGFLDVAQGNTASRAAVMMTGGVGLVVKTRATNVHRRRPFDEALLFGVAVEAHDRAQPAGDTRSSPAQRLEVPAELFDVNATRTEEPDVAFCAPGTNWRRSRRYASSGRPL